MFDRSNGLIGEVDRHCSIGYPISRESTNSSSRIQQQQKQQDHMNLLMSPTESTLDTNQGEYPFQELKTSSRSSLENEAEINEVGEVRPDQMHVVESLSGDVPALNSDGSSRENCDQDPFILDSSMPKQKKSKSKNILRLLKGNGKNTRSKKQSSDHNSTFDPTSAPKVSGSHSPKNNGNPDRKSPRSSVKTSSFSFPFLFHKQTAPSALQTIDCAPPSPPTNKPPLQNENSEAKSLSRKFDNMAWILRQLDNSCVTIERNLMKTFSQKIADWALYSWSASNESALASVTLSFRSELRLINTPPTSMRQHSADGIASASTDEMMESTSLDSTRFPILNPVDPSELLTSINVDECFILPSAHFPLLLCFNSENNAAGAPKGLSQGWMQNTVLSRSHSNSETIYRTSFEILGLHSKQWPNKIKDAFLVQCAVSGVIQESGVR